MKKFTVSGILFILFITVNINAQQFNKSNYYYKVYKTDERITIDGDLSETIWQKTKPITNFYQHYPKDDVPADVNTEVKICYDDKYIYISAKCFEDSGVPVIQTLKRDDITKFAVSDGFSLVIDPINNDKNGYFFCVNLAGAQVDGTLSQSGGQPLADVYWDNLWLAETKRYDDAYVFEIAIPFNSLKYNPEIRKWGINFTRNDMKRTVYYVWTKFPLNFDGSDLRFNGEIEFADGVPKQTDGKFEFFPSISGKGINDYANLKEPEYKAQGGLDAKLAVYPSLNLNLSLYPDFSTVQVDQQYIDFYRFEYYAPEQRLFFLENNDLFSNFGSNENGLTPSYSYKIKPLYTRRIAIKDWEYFQMYYGARFSGNINEKLRLGIMNVQTAKFKDDPSQNYSVATFQQSIFQRSSFRGLFINRQSASKNLIGHDDYNRNAGLEFDYLSKNNKWSILTKYHHSFSPENYKNSNYYSGAVVYNSNKLNMQNLVNFVDNNYVADAGYIPRLYQKDASRDTTLRLGYTQFMSNIFYLFSSSGKISMHAPYANVVMYLQPGKTINEVQQEFGYYFLFSNRSFAFAGFINNYLELLYPFDVLKNDKPLPARKYNFLTYYASWNSDPKKKLNFGFYGDYGLFYNGQKLFLEVRSEYRIQPWGIFQLTYNICNLKFPDEYGSATYHLITNKTEIGFSRKLIWTTLVQYNTQNDNININSLLQWRFRPLSDFYVVLKDDISNKGFDQKKIQVIFKLTYWLKI